MANQQMTVIGDTTNAETSPPQPTNQNELLIVSANHLAGVETVNILMVSGGVSLQVLMPDQTTPATLTATRQGLPLLGGPSYVFDKSATATACGVYIDYMQR